MDKKKTLILIDGHALAFRQYFALERTNMRTSDGTPTWAVFGFFKAVFDLLKNESLKADAIAVAFDVSHHTFRTEKYKDYKCNREAMPDPMQVQMKLIYEGLSAFNIPIYTKKGFEADDVIGTISKKACELGHKVLILTGDQDAFQLVDKEGCVKVILPSKGELIEYNWDRIFEKLGVYPDQVIDYKGLRGDTSDCIPGIKGIGEKTACLLLKRHGTLDNVLAECENIPEKNIRDKICGGKEQAKLSQYLATIVRDLDINFDFDKTKIELPEITKVTEFLKKMQFFGFIKNINEILYSFNKDAAPQASNAEVKIPVSTDGQMQLGFFSQAVKDEINKIGIGFDKKLITDSADFADMLKEIESSTFISFQIMADVKTALHSEIIGIALAYNEACCADKVIEVKNNTAKTKSFYIPIAHRTITNQLLLNDVLVALKPIFENESIKKAAHNAKTEYNVLRNHGINAKGLIFDTLLASYVKDPSRNHDLDAQSIEHLNHAMAEYTPFEKNKKKQVDFRDAQIDNAFNFASDNAATILELAKYWSKTLDERELNILYDIEMPLSLVLSDMEYTGVAVDRNYLIDLSETLDSMINKIEKKIFEIVDMGFNLNSPRQVGELLFDKLGLKTKKKRGKNYYSTNAAVLEELAEENEIASLILQYRKLNKLRTTYTDALPQLIDPSDNRIHTTYNQTVAVTGRLSSSNPNLQNIPIRTVEGNKIRNAFVAGDRENGLILSADYSQIELRLLAHITQDKHLLEAFNGGIDVHILTASKVFEVPVEEVTKDMRYKAKTVNFGIIYGQSKYGLAKTLGITNDEANLFIEKYFATYPRVKAYMEGTIKDAEEKGYVETIFGRKRYLSQELASPNAMIREFAKRAAINQPMQGTAADLLKIAMNDFSKKLKENNLKSKMIMQVHDELVVEVDKSELSLVKKLVKEAMELNQPLSVPLVVDISVGESWTD